MNRINYLVVYKPSLLINMYNNCNQTYFGVADYITDFIFLIIFKIYKDIFKSAYIKFMQRLSSFGSKI